MASDTKMASQRGDGEQNIRPNKLPVDKKAAKLEINASFLRAARAGYLDKVVECLDTDGADINACNPNGLNALHLASKEGHASIVTELLGRGAFVDSATKKGNTSLHIASLAGHEDIVKILVQSGSKVNIQSQTGFTPLYMAAQENHVDVVKYLLEHGANQNLATEDGFTPLSVALQQGHNRVVAVLMENDARNKVRLPALHVAAKKDDVRAATLLLNNEQNTAKGTTTVNDATKSGFTPLHIAAHYGSINVARMLLDNDADINFKARNSITPLHVASKWGRANVVELLVEKNANMECKTRDSLTPLHCAARSGHDQVVDVLLEKGASVVAKTKNGLTPLHMAAQGDHIECAKILLFHKAPIDEVTMDYLTPLHVAAHCGNVKMAKLLLDSKCEVNARALNGFTPLHVACKKNRIKVIELLLRYGAFIESTTESGLTPLHVASFMGHTQIVTYLLENGAKTETATMRGETALHLAARANQIEIMRILIRNGAQVDAKAKEQQTPLHISSRLGSTEAVLLLLHHGATRDAMTKDNYTPLHIAVKEGHEDVVEILLDNGAKHNLTTKKGFTPLHIAAKYGNVPIAKILLQKGASPNVEGKNGLTPLHVATHYNNIEVAQLLLSHKGNVHAPAKNGYTPLHIAAKRNQAEIAKVLLDHGAKPDSESKNGYTPLHLASQEGHTDIAELLLSRGANVNCKSKNFLTPMHLAAQEDHVPIAEILVKYKSEIDPTTKAGYTPLHTACHFGQLNMIQFLLQYGASVHATTKMGYTPLHQAAQQGHVLVINILLKYKASPDALNANGQTPLSIAQQLGYISVVEILKHVTTVDVATPPVTDRYKVVLPETMQEAPIDSDEEGAGDETLPADKSYTYLTVDDSKEMRYQNDQKGEDLFGFETTSGRHSTLSSVMGRDPFQDELRYMRDETEHFGGTLTPSVGGTTVQDEFKYMVDESELRHRSQTPNALETTVEHWNEGTTPVDHWNGSYTQTGRDQDKAVSPVTDDELKYIWSDNNALPVTPAFVQNQLKYGKPVDQSTLPRRAQSEEASIDEVIAGPSHHYDVMAAGPSHHVQGQPSNFSEFDSRAFDSLYSDASVASSFNPDNVSIERQPIILGFLVSFVVDARGGAMRGCRHSGLRIIVPPCRASGPTRITCKLVKRDKLANPPPLNDGESLATRVLKMGPTGATFTGPVLLEVPHFASLRNKEREVTILRSDNGHTWYEHPIVTSEEAVQKCLSGNFEGEELESAEELYQRRVTRILTTDFPVYFALVTRIRQEVKVIGKEGGLMSSTVIPQVQAVFPNGAITKGIRVGLQAQPISDELVAKVLGERVTVSPIVTIEPRHRKFHQPISITIPLPPKSRLRGGKTQPEVGTPSLRLLCSITGGTSQAQWEDITGSSALTLIDDCVNFSTNISARFWLLECPTVKETVPNAVDLYREAVVVPFMSKFMLFAKRRNLIEARLRVFCVTDDRMEKTLENQEHFVEVARSRDVEVLEGRRQYVEIAGNMAPVKANEPLYVSFRPFRENRLPLTVRIKDIKSEPAGQVIFLPDRVRGPLSGEVPKPPAPICVLSVVLPSVSMGADVQTPELEAKEFADTIALAAAGIAPTDSISRAELRLTDIADALQSDWVPLARQLGLTQQEIVSIQRDYTYVSEQALVVLHMWVEKNREQATGNELERALQRINREDIVNRCMHNLETVTDEEEKLEALACLEVESKPTACTEPSESATKAPTELSSAPGGNTPNQDFLETNLDDDLPLQGSPASVPLPTGELSAAVTQLENVLDFPALSFEPSYQSQPTFSDRPFDDHKAEHSFLAPELDQDVPTELHEAQPEPEVSTPSFDLHAEAAAVPAEPASASPTEQLVPGNNELNDVIPDVVSPNYAENHPRENGLSPEETKENIPVDGEAEVVHFPEVTKQLEEGIPYETDDIQEDEQLADDGNVVRRRITTKRKLLPVAELTLEDGFEVSRVTSDVVLGIQIDEVVDVLPPGFDDAYAEGLETESSVEESSEQLPTGGLLERRIVTTVARRIPETLPDDFDLKLTEPNTADVPAVEDAIESTPDLPAVNKVFVPEVQDDFGMVNSDTQFQDEVDATRPLDQSPAVGPSEQSPVTGQPEVDPAATGALATSPSGDQPAHQTSDKDPSLGLRVYSDTTETPPVTETDVQETEEILPDGTVVRRRVTSTQQHQLTSTRVVIEGPEGALPKSSGDMEKLLDEIRGEGKPPGDSMVASIPEVSTDVEEYEEVMPDGTIVKKRIVKTTRQQITTEKLFLGESDYIPSGTESGTDEQTHALKDGSGHPQ